MTLIESCCCWRSVRRGSYASAVYTMIYYTVTTLLLGCYLYEERVVMTASNATRTAGTTASLLQPDVVSEATVAFSVVVLVLSVVGLLSTSLLLIGLRLDKKLLLVPWMIVVALTAAVDVTHIVHVAVISETGFKPEIAMLFTVDFFLLSLNLYSLLCVVSQYQEYKAGRGRAVDEDNFLRLAPVRYLAQPTATSVLSTRRGTHTTVHDGHSPTGDGREARGSGPTIAPAVLKSGGPHGANGANGSNGSAACTVGGLRLAVPPPPYYRRPSDGGPRKHVKFPDMTGVKVVLDEDSSLAESPGTAPCCFLEEGSIGLEWPMDEKALLSTT